MRRVMKLLLSGFSTLALATGAAFAGQNSTIHGSVETSPPDWMSEQYSGPQSDESFSAGLSGAGSGSSAFGADTLAQMNGSFDLERSDMAMQESEVIYVYPVQVTEYYLLIPSESSEMPG